MNEKRFLIAYVIQAARAFDDPVSSINRPGARLLIKKKKKKKFPAPTLKRKTPDLCHATGLQLDDLGYGGRENVSKELPFKSVSWLAFHSERGAGNK